MSIEKRAATLLSLGEFVGSREYYGNTECLYLVSESFYAVAIVMGAEPFEVLSVVAVRDESPQYFQMFKGNQDLATLLRPRMDEGGSFIV